MSCLSIVRAAGLLGGMPGLPTSAWLAKGEGEGDAALPDWLASGVSNGALPGAVRHVFTHFTLDLRVRRFHHPHVAANPIYFWQPINALDAIGLPTLFPQMRPSHVDIN